MMNLLLSLKAAGQVASIRGCSILDGPHWYSTYRCADGNFISVGSLEPKFYALLCKKLGLAGDSSFDDGYDRDAWPELKQRFSEIFAMRTREEWRTLLEGSDACFAPVLDPDEAARHPHMAARGVYREIDNILQAMPAPRFSGSSLPIPGPIPLHHEDPSTIRRGWSKPDRCGITARTDCCE